LKTDTVFIATRGSALALAQANTVLGLCRRHFPRRTFELKVIKTTGDKLQTASLSNPDLDLPKGLFTKEIEDALLAAEATIAVHSLKDLPTDLPEGLILGAVLKRADPRDVLIYRDARHVATHQAARTKSPEDWVPGQKQRLGFATGLTIGKLSKGATVATSSTRREAQLKHIRPDLQIVPIRGNVPTRIQKVADRDDIDATILAAAGLERLGLLIWPDGSLRFGPHKPAGVPAFALPAGILASPISVEEMIPCVGQAAIGLEIRANDAVGIELANTLNHANTLRCVLAERTFLNALGGGCSSPVGAHAEVIGHQIRFRAVSFETDPAKRVDRSGPMLQPLPLGVAAAREIKPA
jgi:hydroxymethylbilane synthase